MKKLLLSLMILLLMFGCSYKDKEKTNSMGMNSLYTYYRFDYLTISSLEQEADFKAKVDELMQQMKSLEELTENQK